MLKSTAQMDNRIHISFYLNTQRASDEKSPVYMRITIAGKREAINTGVFVAKQQWDASKSRIKGKTEEAFANNKLLSAIQTKAVDIYTDCLKQELSITALLIKTKLKNPGEQSEFLIRLIQQHNAYVKRKVGIEVTKATHTKYETLLLKVQGYLRKEYRANDIPLDQLNKGFLMGFELYLEQGHSTP